MLGALRTRAHGILGVYQGILFLRSTPLSNLQFLGWYPHPKSDSYQNPRNSAMNTLVMHLKKEGLTEAPAACAFLV